MNIQQITDLINTKLSEFKSALPNEINVGRQAFYRAKISALEVALNNIVEGVEPDALRDLEYKEPEPLKK